MIDDRLPALWRVENTNALHGLGRLPEKRFQVCCTSPPYFGLRDYGVEPSDWDAVTYELPGGEVYVEPMSSRLGLEETPYDYIGHLVAVFRQVERVLRDDGLLWIVIGDNYKRGAAGTRKGNFGRAAKGVGMPDINRDTRRATPGAKGKDLLGIPWLLAFALRADGWYLRSDIIWSKTNPMPGSQRDRCTNSHEYVFMLAKRERYFYDDVAIREPFADARNGRDGSIQKSERNRGGRSDGYTKPNGIDPSANGGRTKRDVWRIANKPFPDAHFAVFPVELVKPMILASTSSKACSECGAPWQRILGKRVLSEEGMSAGNGFSRPERISGNLSDGDATRYLPTIEPTLGFKPTCEHEGDTGRCAVLDPFAGAGTTGKVAISLGRDFLGLELSPKYTEMARNRIGKDAPLNSAPDPHGSLIA